MTKLRAPINVLLALALGLGVPTPGGAFESRGHQPGPIIPEPPPMRPYPRKLLDQDSWFMRSQAFVAPLGPVDPAGPTRVAEREGSLVVQVPGTDHALEIHRPLRALVEVENYLILQPTDPALFAGRFDVGDPEASEGLFFLDKRYVTRELARARPGRPVPIFFLPLAGRWTGPLAQMGVGPAVTMGFANAEGEVATIDLEQLRRLAKALDGQVRLSLAIATGHQPGRTLGASDATGELELPDVLPPRGGTAAFGTFLTGVDLDHPGNGSGDVARNFVFDFSLLPRAEALAISPDVVDRLIKTAVISGNLWVLTTLLQYSKLRPQVLKRRHFRESVEDTLRAERGQSALNRDQLPRSYRWKREAEENITVYTTGLNLLDNGVEVGVGAAIEYMLDRSGFETARNGWVRKAYEYTFDYVRKQKENLIPNAKALGYGLILGSIDTIGVGAELAYGSPYAMPLFASFISPELEAHTREQFSGANENMNNSIASEFMRNVAIYWVSGAIIYTRDQRQEKMVLFQPEIERELLNEGYNLSDPKTEALINERLEERIERVLVERGLPSREEEILTSPSLVRVTAGAAGYKVDLERLRRSVDFQNKQEFRLAKARQGLVPAIHARAIRHLRALGERFGASADQAQAILLVEEMQRKQKALRRMALRPLDMNVIGREAYKINQITTLLSYEGAAFGKLKFMDLWAPEDPKPLERLITIKAEVLAETRRQNKAIKTREIYKGIEARVEGEPAEVRRAFMLYGGQGRSFEAQLIELRQDLERGVLGAAIRNPRAAALAGRAIRQATFALTDGRPDYLMPDEKDVETFGGEARAEARASAKADDDPFQIEVETLEIIKRKVAERADRVERESWAPAKMSWFERYRTERAHREALIGTEAALRLHATPETEAALARGEGLTSHPAARETYRDFYRRALSRKGGLYAIEGAAVEAEIENLGVIAAAEREVRNFWWGRLIPPGTTREAFEGGEIRARLADAPAALAFYDRYRGEMNFTERLLRRRAETRVTRIAREAADLFVAQNLESNPRWASYLKGKTEDEIARFGAHQYAETFLAKYVELTFNKSSVVPLTSPAQPGYFMRLRQTELFRPESRLGRALTYAARFSEAAFDGTAVRVGLDETLRRRIPFAQDLKGDFINRSHAILTRMLVTYSMTYYLWGVHFDFPSYLLLYATGLLTNALANFAERSAVNTGSPPMGTWQNKAKYSVWMSFWTYWSYVPFFFLQEPTQALYNEKLAQPVNHAFKQVVEAVKDGCAAMLGGFTTARP